MATDFNLDELQAATDYYIEQEQPVDVYFKSNVLVYMLLSKGKTYPGGKKIQINLEYGEQNSGPYGPRSEIAVQKKEIITAAFFEYAAYYASLTMDMDDDLQNSGDLAIVNLLRAKLNNAEKTLRKSMATDIYLAKSTARTSSGDPNSRPFDGLGDLFQNSDSSKEYGEISADQMDGQASTSGLWSPNVVSSAKTMSFSLMQEVRRQASVDNGNEGKPDLYLTTQTLQDAFERTLQVQARYSDKKLLDAGFDNILFKGAPIVDDDQVSSGDIYALNTMYLDILTHVKRNFTRPEWKSPIRQPDTATANIRWAGNLVCKRRDAHAYYSNVSEPA